MQRLYAFNWVLAGSLLLMSFAAAAVDDPQVLVRETGERVLAEVSARKPELEADPTRIYPLVAESILPHFDFEKMSQSAMGRYWRQATDAQKQDVTREFRELLVRTYATALLGFTGQEIEYLPFKAPEAAERVVVSTRITPGGSPPIPIDYRLERNDASWLVYDVVIDGVSLVTNYRSQFNTLARRSGIDGLISALASKNRDPSKP